jgi:acyl-CoA dehydrogenase
MPNAEFELILAEVRRFVRERVVPVEAEIEETDEMPRAVREQAAAMGLFGFALPHRYGGLGLSMHDQVRLVAELGYTTPALRSMVGTNNGISGQTVAHAGTEEQKARYLPRLASGEWVACFGLTEPEAGSDPSTITTAARRDGDEWVLDGTKRYITNAPVADVFMIFARSDPDAAPGRGISAFVVERGAPGLSVGPRDHKMGQAGAWIADVILDGVRVPHTALVGETEGTGYRTAMRSLAHGRMHIAALCVGMAQRLVDESVSWARSRRQGGRPIGDYQLVQAMLADSQTDLMAGRALVLDAARAFDSGADTRMGPACAKYFASEMVGRVADRAVQVHGGAGYIRGVPVERFYRDARLFRIYEGTSQIQQVLIARELLGR